MRRHGQDSLIQTKAGAKLPNVGIFAASLARVSEHLAVVFNGLKISKRELDTLTGALLAHKPCIAMLCQSMLLCKNMPCHAMLCSILSSQAGGGVDKNRVDLRSLRLSAATRRFLSRGHVAAWSGRRAPDCCLGGATAALRQTLKLS